MEISEIRNLLRECENSIIFSILERARWKLNKSAYIINITNTKENSNNQNSLFTRMLVGTELLHAKLGRYECPEEHQFTDILFENSQSLVEYKINKYLISNHSTINLNKVILEDYFKKVLPKITEPGEDENLGSAVTADINLLQAISRRIHLGKLVAQAKFNSEPESYSKELTDITLKERLTNQEVENTILERILEKLNNFKYNVDFKKNELISHQLNTAVIKEIYKDFIIPLTKQVQINYFRLLLDK